MQKHKSVEEIMVNVFDFPVVPSWYTIRQAIDIIQKSTPAEKNLQPVGLLIFDEHYNLLGSLSVKDILKGIEPRYLKPVSKAQVHQESDEELSLIWDSLFDTEARKLAERQVSDCMVPVKHFVTPEDPVTKAAYLMTHHELAFLPVLEGRKKLVGVVRMFDIFQEVSNIMRQE